MSDRYSGRRPERPINQERRMTDVKEMFLYFEVASSCGTSLYLLRLSKYANMLWTLNVSACCGQTTYVEKYINVVDMRL